MKKIIPALLILLILLSGLPPPALSESVRSPEIILYVGGSGPNNYTKIQDAINASQPGDRIYVYSGIYYERIVIDKTISLIGESRENTVIINWDERANIVSIVADGVHMNNFSIVGGMPAGNRGIHLVQFSNNIITNCAICNTSCGILIGSPSHSNQIINCTLHNNSYGIRIISSPNNKLRGNSLENNHYNLDVGEIYYQDIDRSNTINGRPVYYILEQANLVFNETMNIGYLGLVSCNNISVYNIELHNNVQGFLLVNTSYSTLTNCVCHDHSYSLCLLKSSNNQITDFVCYNSGGAGRGGMDIRHSSNNTLTNCTCYKNYGFRLSGIHLCNSCNNTLINCVCYHNAEDGIRLSQLSTNNNIINCSCYENNYGIELSSSNNKIMSCSCYGNYYGDILLDRSSSNIVTNCICKNAGGYGIELCYSSNCVLTHCQVSGTSKGIYLLGSGNNEIMSCSCYQNSYGLYLDKSPNNCITNCSFCNNNEDGLYLDKSPNNCITNCSFSNNHRGLSLFSSPGNRLRSNNLENNRCNLNINGEEISDYHQDITLSNTINGKPIYYLIEENSRVVDGIADIGYLGIVSCSNITVRSVNISYNGQGLLLANTTHTEITDCAFHNNYEGVLCYSSSNNDFSNLTIYNNSGHGLRLRCSEWNQIVACAIYNNYGHNVFFEGVSHNTLMGCICYNSSNDGIRFSSSNNNILTECITYNNYCGISLDNSSGNSMSYCTAFNNSHGVMLVSSSDNNTITNCNVYNNFYGIYISSSSNNLIYNNYFDNTNNAYSYGGSGNRWNITKTLGGNIVNGAYLGGNYWSDYAGIDADGDGLGDVPYLILGSTREQDKLPLIRGVALLQQLPNLFLYVGIIIVIIVICFGIMAIKKSKK